MADIAFPRVSFDWIGELPQIAEESRMRRARASLGDLKLNTSRDLENAASRAAGLGLFDDALKLSTLASQRKSAEASMLSASQRGMFDQLLYNRLMNPSATPTKPAATDVFQAPQTLPIGPSPTPTVPPSTLPGLPGLGSVGPGAALSPSPSEALLAQAETPSTPAGPPAQVAQAGGPVSLPAPPPTMQPTAPVPFRPLTTEPVAPISRPQGLQAPMTQDPQIAQAINDANDSYAKILEMSRGGPRAAALPEFRAEMTRFNSALARTKADEKEISYQQESLRRNIEGEQPITREDFKRSSAASTQRDAAMERTYEGYQKKGESARALVGKLDQIQRIVNDDRFAPGENWAAQRLDAVRNGVASLIATAKAGGIPISPELESLVARAVEPTALREAFSAIQRQVVIEGMGGLGVGRSNADLVATSESYGPLSATKQGLNIIYDALRETANRTARQQMAASEYANKHKDRVTGTSYGMDTAVHERMQEIKDPILIGDNGRLTELGRRADTELKKIRGYGLLESAPPAPPSARQVAPARATPQVTPEGRIPIKRGDKKFWYDPATGEETPR